MHVLPRADVDAFLLSAPLTAVFDQMVQDWRMSRVTISVLPGGLTGAIERYRQRPSPGLVVIEVAAGATAMLAEIESLASVCQPDTRAIVIGQVNDVRLYRQLTALGVSDYLVPPLSANDLILSLAKALDASGNSSHQRLVAVVGGKGGGGATTTAQSLAHLLGNRLRETCLLLDLGGIMGTAGILFGAEGREALEDYMLDPGRIESEEMKRRAMRLSENLFVIAGGRGSMPTDQFPRDAVDQLLDVALSIFPNVIVDVPTGWGTIARHVAARADTVVVVAEPRLSSLRCAKTVIDDVRGYKGEQANLQLVLSRVGEIPRSEVPEADILRSLNMTTLTRFAYQPQVLAGLDFAGAGFPDDKPTAQALQPLEPVAMSLVGSRPKVEREAFNPLSVLRRLIPARG